MEMPESFVTRMLDHRPTLREIINYHAYDDAWIPDVLAGRTIDEVGKDAFKGDLLGDTPKQSFSAIVDKAVAAAQALDDLSRTAHLSYGDYTMAQYLWQANYFRGMRVYDIAKVIGVDPTLPDATGSRVVGRARPGRRGVAGDRGVRAAGRGCGRRAAAGPTARPARSRPGGLTSELRVAPGRGLGEQHRVGPSQRSRRCAR